MLLNNKWVNNEIKEEIKRYFEINKIKTQQPPNLYAKRTYRWPIDT